MPHMRTIIAGPRSITDDMLLIQAVHESGFYITHVLSGGARGVDRMGENYAGRHKIPWTSYPANWRAYGKKAGYLRNEQMALHADALIAIWDGKSPGTKHMLDIAEREGLKVYVLAVLDGEDT